VDLYSSSLVERKILQYYFFYETMIERVLFFFNINPYERSSSREAKKIKLVKVEEDDEKNLNEGSSSQISIRPHSAASNHPLSPASSSSKREAERQRESSSDSNETVVKTSSASTVILRSIIVTCFTLVNLSVWLVLAVAMFYLISDYGKKIGERSIDLLSYLFAILVIEEFILSEPLMIAIKFNYLHPSSFLSQFNHLFQYLMIRSKMILIRRNGLISHANDFIHHFNKACRLARSYPTLPIARFLMSLNDLDIPLLLYHQRSFSSSSSSFFFSILASPYRLLSFFFFSSLPRALSFFYYVALPAPGNTFLLSVCSVSFINLVAYVLHFLFTNKYFAWYIGSAVLLFLLFCLLGMFLFYLRTIRQEKQEKRLC
jgi:hypothetical protein